MSVGGGLGPQTMKDLQRNGIYLSAADPKNSRFYCFSHGKGFSSKENAEFSWIFNFPIVQLKFANVKQEITYREGTIKSTVKRELLMDSGALYDSDGIKLQFCPATDFLEGVVYKSEAAESLNMGGNEHITHIMFNTTSNKIETANNELSIDQLSISPMTRTPSNLFGDFQSSLTKVNSNGSGTLSRWKTASISENCRL